MDNLHVELSVLPLENLWLIKKIQRLRQREKKPLYRFWFYLQMSITKRVAVFLFWEYGLILNYFEDEKITIFSFRRL